MNKYIEYVTSKSIREYLNKINFEPSGYEAAYIVYTNQTLSLSKKFELWKEIIETYPDDADYCSIYADIYKDKIISVGEIYILDDTAKKTNEYFEKYSPKIPLPFKKGDIIYSARNGAECKLLVFKDYCREYIKVFKAGDDESKSFLIKGLDIDYVNEDQ